MQQLSSWSAMQFRTKRRVEWRGGDDRVLGGCPLTYIVVVIIFLGSSPAGAIKVHPHAARRGPIRRRPEAHITFRSKRRGSGRVGRAAWAGKDAVGAGSLRGSSPALPPGHPESSASPAVARASVDEALDLFVEVVGLAVHELPTAGDQLRAGPACPRLPTLPSARAAEFSARRPSSAMSHQFQTRGPSCRRSRGCRRRRRAATCRSFVELDRRAHRRRAYLPSVELDAADRPAVLMTIGQRPMIFSLTVRRASWTAGGVRAARASAPNWTCSRELPALDEDSSRPRVLVEVWAAARAIS